MFPTKKEKEKSRVMKTRTRKYRLMVERLLQYSGIHVRVAVNLLLMVGCPFHVFSFTVGSVAVCLRWLLQFGGCVNLVVASLLLKTYVLFCWLRCTKPNHNPSFQLQQQLLMKKAYDLASHLSLLHSVPCYLCKYIWKEEEEKKKRSWMTLTANLHVIPSPLLFFKITKMLTLEN